MKWKLQALLLPVLFLSFAAGAAEGASLRPADCGDVRLDEPGGPMEHVPVFDQGASVACYAHAAATLINAERFTLDPPLGDRDYQDITSPVDAALEEILDKIRHPIDPEDKLQDYKSHGGARVVKVVDELKKVGSCSQKQLAPFTQGNRFDVKILDQLEERYHGAIAKASAAEHQKNVQLLKKFLAESVCRISTENPADEIQRLENNVDQILAQPRLKDPHEDEIAFLVSTLSALCEPRRPIPEKVTCHEFPAYEISEKKQRQQIVDSMLDAKVPHPVGIGFCGGLLRAKGGGMKFNGLTDYPNESENCSAHAAVVIGRRWNASKSSCEYLIRNSWGTECRNAYHSDWECEEGRGNVWVNRDVLMTNTDQLEYMEP